MKLRKRYLSVAAVLGVAVLGAAVSPALATASEVKLEVAQNCFTTDWACWNPVGNPEKSVPESEVPPFKLAQGGTIFFEDKDSQAPTDVIWKSALRPTSCTGVVEAPPIKTGWSGTCTFATAGEYEFESEELFKNLYSNYRKYKVMVAGAPMDKTTSASGETQTEAMLNGSIEPKGNTVEYHFEYGSGSVTEHTTSASTLSAADFTSHSVSVPVTGLQPGMTYQFQLVATYGGNTVTGATTQTFTTHAVTAPTATTLAAEGLKETEATLKGTINPGGEATEYFFEYGTGTGYGQKTEKAILLASGGNQSVSTTLKGLTPGTEYHFRLVAKNNQGPAEGLDGSFTTMPPPTKEPPAKEPSPTPTPTPTVGIPTATTSSSPSSGEPKTEPAPGPLFGSLELVSTQHGGVVHGSLVVSSAGSEGRLQIELLTKGAAAPVGKLVRSSLHAGKLTFALTLSSKAKHTLKTHHKLTLTVRIVLTPKHGAAMTLTRSVVVR
ncbi:MAG TPA: fibronectin type III domain-containing protein [Solirubrobacteraceae bacterium]|nr:fibronectin type III domain-containing protein [Solirubrobacteraceae bacterium]